MGRRLIALPDPAAFRWSEQARLALEFAGSGPRDVDPRRIAGIKAQRDFERVLVESMAYAWGTRR